MSKYHLRCCCLVTGMFAVVSSAVCQERAFDGILAGQGRDLRFEIVGFGSPNSWIPRVRALDILVTGTISPTRYELEAEIKTVGLASLFVRQGSTIRIEGRVSEQGLHPTFYRSQNRRGRVNTAVWTQEDVEVTTTYPEGIEPEEDLVKQREQFVTTLDQKLGGVDFITALFGHMIGATTYTDGVCSGRLPIFDTVRRYDLVLSFDSEVYFNDGVWKGQVQQCGVRFEQVSLDTDPDLTGDGDQDQMTWKFAQLGPGKPNFLVAMDVRRSNGARLNLVVNRIVYKRT